MGTGERFLRGSKLKSIELLHYLKATVVLFNSVWCNVLCLMEESIKTQGKSLAFAYNEVTIQLLALESV